MVIASPRAAFRDRQPVPIDWPDEREHRRLLARAAQEGQEHERKYPVDVVSKTAAYAMTDIDLVILGDATSGAFSVTLLTAAGRAGRRVIVKKTDASANTVTIDPAGTETIDGETTIALSQQHAGREIVSDGTNWWIVSAHGYATT